MEEPENNVKIYEYKIFSVRIDDNESAAADKLLLLEKAINDFVYSLTDFSIEWIQTSAGAGG